MKPARRFVVALVILAPVLLAGAAFLANWLNQRAVSRGELCALFGMREIASAEETFRSAVVVDQDGDGWGEFGTFDMMTATNPPLLGSSSVPHPWPTKVYRFAIYIGSAADPALQGIDSDEAFYLATAVPLRYGRTGRRSFCVDASGEIRGTDAGGKEATISAFGPAWVFRSVSPSSASSRGRSLAISSSRKPFRYSDSPKAQKPLEPRGGRGASGMGPPICPSRSKVIIPQSGVWMVLSWYAVSLSPPAHAGSCIIPPLHPTARGWEGGRGRRRAGHT